MKYQINIVFKNDSKIFYQAEGSWADAFTVCRILEMNSRIDFTWISDKNGNTIPEEPLID
jgi:hypothetical protein